MRALANGTEPARSGILFVISAPSGAGKTSLVRALVGSFPELQVSVSHTTRARRPGEREGQDYFFVSRDEFLDMIDEDRLLEHALVFDNYYGTSKDWVAETLAGGTDVVLEIDWQGARQVRQHFPQTVSVEVFPPSLEDLEARLRHRAQDSEDVIARRMRDAVEEMQHFQEFDYLVVNDDFEVTLEQVESIVRAERARVARASAEHAPLVEHLLSDGKKGEPKRRAHEPHRPSAAGLRAKAG